MPLVPSHSTVALKEWSAAIAALARGDQTVLVRKGGIREGAGGFKVQHDGFFLYPTFFHQASELVKPQFRPLLDGLDDDPEPAMVTLSVYAEVEEVIEVADEAAVRALAPFHIFTDEYAEKRAHWKPRVPLTVMAVRCHKMQQPQALPVMAAYAGCKSWVELVEPYPVGVTTPVLPERRAMAQVAALRQALAGAAAVSDGGAAR